MSDETQETAKLDTEIIRHTEWVSGRSEPIPTYVETWVVVLGNSEVKVRLGDNISIIDGVVTAREAVTLTFAHAGFVQFVNEMNKTKAFLEDLYDGSVPRLETIAETKDVNALIGKHYHNKQ